MINVFQPALGDEELAAIGRVFKSNWVGKGNETKRFEQAFAGHIGSDTALLKSMSCCTEGLFQSMTLLDIGPGDEVVLPAVSFVGAGNAVAGSGAEPVFCDVDPRALNPTADMIEAGITKRSKAIMIQHYGGVPCDMDSLRELADGHGVALIEDCACGVASTWRGRACGTFGDVSAWSFDAMKILVTGDGGMLRCRTKEMAERAEKLLYLGLRSKSGFANPAETKWWEFEIDSPGRRAIMNDISSAIGLEQLKKLPGFIARRRAVHDIYNEAFAPVEWLRCPPPIPESAESSYYLYWIQTAPDARDRLAQYLFENGVYTTFRYHPLHRVEFYRRHDAFPNAETAADTTLCLPIHPSLSSEDLDKVIDCVLRFGKDRL